MFLLPVIPGPLMKNPKASLYCEFTYSQYSSEPKTKSNCTCGAVGTKSNSIVDRSHCGPLTTPARSGSSGELMLKPPLAESEPFGPGRIVTAPVASTIPFCTPMLVAPLVKVPRELGLPAEVMLATSKQSPPTRVFRIRLWALTPPVTERLAASTCALNFSSQDLSCGQDSHLTDSDMGTVVSGCMVAAVSSKSTQAAGAVNRRACFRPGQCRASKPPPACSSKVEGWP